MTDPKPDAERIKLEDILHIPVGELLDLPEAELEDLIIKAEENLGKARRLKSWLKGIRARKNAKPKGPGA